MNPLPRLQVEPGKVVLAGEWTLAALIPRLPELESGLATDDLDVYKRQTLVMRPFNFDTLATQVYTLASDERLAEASTASLAIVAVGLLPLIALSRQISQARK